MAEPEGHLWSADHSLRNAALVYGDCRGLSLFNDNHPPIELQSSGKQGTVRLSTREVSVARVMGGIGSKPRGQLHCLNIWCHCVWGVASSAISVNSHQQINLHSASSFFAGHLNDTSLQHLPGLRGVRLIKKDLEADSVRSRRRLYRACRRWEKQRAASSQMG